MLCAVCYALFYTYVVGCRHIQIATHGLNKHDAHYLTIEGSTSVGSLLI